MPPVPVPPVPAATASARRDRGAPRHARLRTAGMVVAALLLAAAALAATHAWWLAPWVSGRLSASSGRSVQIERIVVGWSPGGGLQVALRGVRIANAAWADPAWPLADAGEVLAHVAVARSLAERRPVIAELVLRDARIDLERQADGLRNWRLRKPTDRGPGRYKVLSLTAQNSDVRFVHGGIGLALEASARPAPDDDTRHPTRIDLRARWRGVDFGGRFVAARTLTFLETGRKVPLQGALALRGVSVELDGEAGDLFRAPLIDARLSVRATAVEPVRAAVRVARSRVSSAWPEMQVPLVAAPAPATAKPAFALDADVHVEPRRIAFEALRVRFGDSDLAGRVSWEQEGRADVETAVQAAASAASGSAPARASAAGASATSDAPELVASTPGSTVSAPASRRLRITRLQVDARSERVVLEQLREALSGWSDDDGAEPKAAAQVHAASAPAAKARVASASAPTAARAVSAPAPRWPEADIRYGATHARWSGGPPLGPLRVEATVRDQRAEVQVLELGMAGGRIVGRATVDGRVQPPRAEATLRIAGVDAAALRPGADAGKRITGRIDGRARLALSGGDTGPGLRGLDGRVDLTLRDGTLPARVDAGLGLQTLRIARSVLGSPDAVPLPCAALGLDVHDGVARVRQLVLDSERTRTQGRGRIDLAARTLDLTLTGETKGRALLVLDRSIRLHGPLAKPERELVPRVEMAQPACSAG